MSTDQNKPFLSIDPNYDSSEDFLSLSLGNSKNCRRSNPASVASAEMKDTSSVDFLSLSLGNSLTRDTDDDLGILQNLGNLQNQGTTDLGISLTTLGNTQNQDIVDFGNSPKQDTNDLEILQNRGNTNPENSQNPDFDPLCPTSIKRNKSDLETMADKLGLPEAVKNQAYENFKKVEEEQRRKRRNVLYAACIYISCRQNAIALSLEEIESVADGASATSIYKKAKSLAPTFGLEPDLLMHIRVDEFTKRFCSALQIDSKVATAAQATAENSSPFVSNRTPLAVAATIIYVVSRVNYEKKLFRDIMEATGVAEGTMNEIYKDLYPNLLKILPKGFADSKDIKKLHRPN